jgi:hypothetical protein
VHAGSSFKAGKSRVKVYAYLTGNQLSTDRFHGDPVLFHGAGLRGRYRYFFQNGWRVVGKYQYADEECESAHSDRDGEKHDLQLGMGYYLFSPVYFEGGLFRREERARESSFFNNEEGIYLNFNGSLPTISYSFRFEYVERDYLTRIAGEENFGRRDNRKEFRIRFHFPLRKKLKLTLSETYLEGDSTRPDRNFHRSEFGLGLVYSF